MTPYDASEAAAPGSAFGRPRSGFTSRAAGGPAAGPPLVTLDEIRAAAGRIRAVARRTPLIGPHASGRGQVWLKCENFQPTGAFKIRGACNMVAQLSTAAREAGVITYSSGNHGQAVALVARHFGVPAVVVMPATAPAVKVEGVRRYGAEVIVEGTTSAERRARAEAEAAARGMTIVPPFDHPWIVAGAGTVGLELLEECPQARAVYVPVGGGGLVSGVAAAVKGMRSGVRVVGVEPAGAPRMSASLGAGHPVTLDAATTVADGLRTLRPGEVTFAHIQALVDEVVTVTDDRITGGMAWLFREARVAAEPSGAAAVAAALDARDAEAVAIVTGGNVSAEDFARYVGTGSR
jgi:threonine dehydratase